MSSDPFNTAAQRSLILIRQQKPELAAEEWISVIEVGMEDDFLTTLISD